MHEPLSQHPPSDREAWVEAQVWRRCVEARREGAGVASLDREALRAIVANAKELPGGAGAEAVAEDERLLELAQSALALSMLPARRAPAALDAVLEELEDLEPEVEEADPQWGPDLLASFQREESNLRELMAALRPQPAPAALDAHFEAELARHERRALDLATPSSPTRPSLAAPESPRGAGSSSGLRLVWRRRAVWAAAAVLLGAIGVAIFWRDGAVGGAQGEDAGPRTASRFSFRYVSVETAGADVANRPALRLLRGWASHISPDALEPSSTPK